MSTTLDLTTLHTELFIDGVWQPAASSATFAVENPATRQIIAEVADGGPEDAQRAIAAAGRAQASLVHVNPSATLGYPAPGLRAGPY